AKFDERRPAVVVTIDEGTRYLSDKIEVEGASTVPVEKLQKLLADSKLGWKKGKPASCSDIHWKSKNEEVRNSFQALGYLDLQFSMSVRTESDKSATLVVTILDEGPRAVLGEYEIVGAQKNSAQDIIDLIDVPLGTVLDSDMKKQIEKKLWNSARFI